MGDAELVTEEGDLARLADRLARADRIALDVEANGLFAYRPSLCTLQLAFHEDSELRIVIVDTLAVRPAPLAEVLGKSGPLKVLHDLSFDAELLGQNGVELDHVRDTSIAARFLGQEATGLSSVVETELGLHIDKALQQHDWAKRPLTEVEVAYLAGDVRHLLVLDDRLTERSIASGVLEEVEEESRHRALRARERPNEAPPGYTKLKNVLSLGSKEARAILRRVWQLRESLAEKADVPPYRILANELLLKLCRDRPLTPEALMASIGKRRPSAPNEPWLEAVKAGIAEGDVPPEDRSHFERPTFLPGVAERERRFENRLGSWRKVEAKRREVSDQAILPGHCSRALATVLARDHASEDERVRDIRSIAGMGDKRLGLYLTTWLSFVDEMPPTPPAGTPPTLS